MPAVAGREHVERLGDHRALDAAARHRARHLAVLVHRHGRPRHAGPGALDVDDPGHGDLLARRPPALDVVEDLLHA